MKIGQLIEYVGACEPVRVIDEDFKEICSCMAHAMPEEVRDYFIKSVFCQDKTIHIITALDKKRKRWYNKGNGAE